MLEPGQEMNGGNGWSVSRGFFERMLEQADGNVSEAVEVIEDPFEALSFLYGYRDRLAEEGVTRDEAHRHAIVRIYRHLGDVSYGDTEILTARHALWEPVFDFVKRKEELGSSWERVRDTVHFFDEADERILTGGLELS